MSRDRFGWLRWVLIAGVAGFGVSTLPGVRETTNFNWFLDGWVQGGLHVVAAVVCALRPLREPDGRAIWWCITAGIAARSLGFVLYLGHVRHLDPIPYPSIADAAWLAVYVGLLAGLVLLARSCVTKLSVSLTLDGVVGALAAGSVGVAALYGTLQSLTADDMPSDVVATNLAYPVLDLMLVILLLGVMVSASWNPPPAVVVLLVGVAGFALTDAIFLYQASAGTFHPGSPLATLSLASSMTMALAGRLEDRSDGRAGRDTLPTLLLPGCFVAACLAVLSIAALRPVNVVAVALAAAGLIVAALRTSLSFRLLRQVAGNRWGSRTDELTGLANLRVFRQDVAAALRTDSTTTLALIIVDLDELESINAAYGFDAGDELLRAAAQRLQQTVGIRELPARIGGDEFAVLAEVGNEDASAELVRRIRAQLHRPFDLDGAEVLITATVGVAIAPDDADDAAGLLRNAELALRHAKSTAADHVRFRPELHKSSERRKDTIQAVEQALDDGEICVLYQPKVELPSGATVGVEALVRWQHPTQGLLPPAAFLPAVEGSGLMERLTQRVLAIALQDTAAWHRAGHRPTVAVNVTVNDLLRPGFPAVVGAALEHAGLSGKALELELTEELFVTDPRRARVAMQALGELGVRVVIDDYGTGYSSLGYLHGLEEVGGLKIDQTFIRHLDKDERAQAIVASTLTLAGSIGLEVVAEGVETEQVRDQLVALGCQLAQGYLFSPPVVASSITFA